MNYKISKELFEAVIERNDIEIFRLFKNEITFVFKDDWLQNNIKYNDFFFKCKEWAFKNNFVLSSQLTNYFDATNDTVRILGYCYIENINTSPNFYSHSEQQAVFDACQYILDKKDKQ